MKTLDWNKLSEKEKKEIFRPRRTSLGLAKQKPIFLCGPVEMSSKRIQKLIKQLSAKKPLVFGILKDEFIPGLESSFQFKSLSLEKVEDSIEEIREPRTENRKLPNEYISNLESRVTFLEYHQRDWDYILKELDFSAVILVHGSWYKQIHLRKEFWTIINKKIPYKFISRFENEHEAKTYMKKFSNLPTTHYPLLTTESDIFNIVDSVAKKSFDWTFQTGAALVRDEKVILTSHNKIVPFETSAMLHGSSREKNFTPPNDQNHYDTNHAEVELLIKAVNEKIDISNSTLYINLLPCPTCARMLSETNIREVVYKLDHSDGYAFKLLTESGKIVRRFS